MNKLFIFLILIFGLTTSANAEIKRIVSGNQNAKITIIAYESLTSVSYTHLTLPTKVRV